MPLGTPNFVLAAVILALKATLLLRVRALPAFSLYLGVGCVTSALYLLGWHLVEAAWTVPVAILGLLSALEVGQAVTLGMGDGERSEVFRWCVMLGTVLCFTGAVGEPLPYPNYPSAFYFFRLYSGLGSVGILAGLLGYCFSSTNGVRFYVIHASLLLVRLAAMTALLLVHSREGWFAADLAGSVVNAVTLAAWLGLFRLRRLAV